MDRYTGFKSDMVLTQNPDENRKGRITCCKKALKTTSISFKSVHMYLNLNAEIRFEIRMIILQAKENHN